MQCPFPGMDPYLEAPYLWSDVHNSLIYALRDQIQPQLSSKYAAVITPFVAYETLEIAPVRVAAIPDLGIFEERAKFDLAAPTLLVEAAPLVLPIAMKVPTRYTRLELRTIGDEQLVTAIELLSPANKRPGADGADAYEHKRQELFQSTAHLLEIDLLRAGQRLQVAGPLPAYPYFIFLSRVEKRPHAEIWPLSLRQPFPRVPIPLRRPDPDIVMDLNVALQQIYTSAAYERRINYRLPPPKPELAADDVIWLDERLHTHALRP